MMARTLKALIAGLALFALTFATGAHAETVLRLATQVARPHPFLAVAAYFKKHVEEQTHGQVKVKIFPNASLGKDSTVLNEMKYGTIDLIISSTDNAAKELPEFQIFDLYYLFPNYKVFNKITAPGSPVFKRFQAIADRRHLGLKILALFGSGTRNLSVSTHPVKSLADIRGLKMRVPPSHIVAESWKALGTVPVTVAWPELYAAIQTGVAQGLESTLSGYLGSKLYEVAPYLALTHHTINGSHFSMSKLSWQKLTPKQQKIVAKVATQAAKIGTQKGIEADNSLVSVLTKKYKVTVTRPGTAPFMKAIEPLYGKFAAQMHATKILKLVQEAE